MFSLHKKKWQLCEVVEVFAIVVIILQVYQVNKLYILNLHSVTCQSYLNKTGGGEGGKTTLLSKGQQVQSAQKTHCSASPGIAISLGVTIIELMLFYTPNVNPQAWACGTRYSDTLLLMGIQRC